VTTFEEIGAASSSAESSLVGPSTKELSGEAEEQDCEKKEQWTPKHYHSRDQILKGRINYGKKM